MASMKTISSEVKVDVCGLRKHYLTLTKCQQPFVKLVANWIKNPRKMLVIISGGPGTGKTYVVKNTLDYIKTLQLRMSYTARSAVSIGGKTIHSTIGINPSRNNICDRLQDELKDETDLLSTIKQSREILKHFRCEVYPYIVVVDEISMINGWLIYWLIRFFMDRTHLPLLFVCMGDPHQLNPIKSIHNLFSIMFSEKKFDVRKVHLTESKRFVPEYEKIINILRKFVDEGNETEMFTFVCENFPVVQDIDRNVLLQSNMAMAFKNDTVNYWNNFYIKNMVAGPEIKINDNLIFKEGCMVFITRNGCSHATNGTKLIFDKYDDKNDVFMCKDPKTNVQVKVCKDFYGNVPLVLGYAGTVHKYQGDTIDDAKIVISFDGSKDLNLVYTALSRVREMDQILAIKL